MRDKTASYQLMNSPAIHQDDETTEDSQAYSDHLNDLNPVSEVKSTNAQKQEHSRNHRILSTIKELSNETTLYIRYEPCEVNLPYKLEFKTMSHLKSK